MTLEETVRRVPQLPDGWAVQCYAGPDNFAIYPVLGRFSLWRHPDTSEQEHIGYYMTIEEAVEKAESIKNSES